MDLRLSGADLTLEKGDLDLVDGVDAIAQHLRIRLRTFKGEWFLDERIGVPFFDTILVKNANLAAVQSVLRRAVLTTPGITGIDQLDVDLDAATRVLTVTMRAQSTSGPVALSEEVVIA